MKTANFLHRVIAAALMIAALATGQQAMAETVTYTISGSTEQTGNVNFKATASGSATGTVTGSWDYTSTQSYSISLPGSINLSFGTDKTSSLIVQGGLRIQATATDGGYITLSASKYIYHITLKNDRGTVFHEAWNLEKSYTYRFQEMRLETIIVEYADLIPIDDAEIQGVDDQYVISNESVMPQPTGVIWHGIRLSSNHYPPYYSLSWANTGSEGTATITATGSSCFTGAATKNYTLVWATYTVHFNKNNTSASGSMSDQAFTYSISQNLTANAFTRTGYTFDKWNRKADGTGTSYTDGKSVKNLTSTNGATVNLYAQWAPITYTVRFHSNYGGEDVTTDQTFTYDQSQQLTANAFTRTGYAFDGWSTTSDGAVTYTNGESVSNLTTTEGAIVDLYAHWTPITYHITYDAAGGQVPSNSPTTYTIESGNITIPILGRTGYTFLGWTGTDLTEPTQVVTIPAGSTGDRSYTANWSIINYTITYNLNGGEWPEGQIHPDTYTYETPTFTIGTPTITGYRFLEWSGDNPTIRQHSTGNRAYSASWAVIGYTIHFNANGGEGSMRDQTVVYDYTFNLTANAFTRTDYVFAGWNTKADGTGTAYTDGQSVSNLTTTHNDTINLYAQWTTAYTIHFDANGGIGNGGMDTMPDLHSMPDLHTVYGSEVIIPHQNFIRTGYTFSGWNTKADGTGTAYTSGQSVSNLTTTPNDTVNLYAQWTPITYTVSFNANYGEGTMSYMDFTYDEAQNLTANAFTRTGYIFDGWNTRLDGTGESYTDGQSVSNLTTTNCATVTLYAQWTPIVPYIDADGTEKFCTNFTFITSSNGNVRYGNSNDEENWYVVSGEVTISGQLNLYGQASHLILCDGATLTVTGSTTSGIDSSGHLTLYGQSQQSGTLNACTNSNSSSVAGIYTSNGGDLTINGGIINATSAYYKAIYAVGGNVVINRGTVNAAAEGTNLARGIEAKNITINGGIVNATSNISGIQASGGDVTINGGRVTATGGSYGIYASYITLGWTNASDSITASSYRIGDPDYGYFLKVADGQALTDGTDTYTGTLTDTQRNAIAGQTLVPYTSISVGDVNGDGEVNIADVTALVALILSDSPYHPVADINGDNRLSIADVTALVNNIKDGN